MMESTSFFARFLEEMRLNIASPEIPMETVSDFPDLGLRSALFGPGAPFRERFPETDASGDESGIWILQDRFRCRYLFSSNGKDGKPWLVGPYLTEDLTPLEIEKRFERLEIYGADLGYLRQYYLALPKLRDENMLDALLHIYGMETYGTDRFQLRYWELKAEETPAIHEKAPSAANHVRDNMDRRYALEKQMMVFISQGNYRGTISATGKLEAYGLEARTGSTLRDSKNFTIVLNTLCRVAARNGGVHPVELDRLSRELALHIENAADTHALREVRDQILRDYCGLVNETKDHHYSPTIQAVLEMLAAEFASDITLKDLAAKCGLSANYLSSYLKKETGRTFLQHLTATRIENAKELLTNTSLPIHEVASQCGIQDNNYFSRLFKANTGHTPQQYRELNSI